MEELEQRVLLSSTASAAPSLSNPIVPVPPLPTGNEPLQGVVGTPFSLDPQLFDGAYGFDGIWFVPPGSPGTLVVGNGGGLPGANQLAPETDIQTIAIVDAYGSPTIVNDLQTFDEHWGITNDDAAGNFCLTVQPLGPTVNTFNEPAADIAGWSAETSLDVEWAHAVAPGAHILLVEAPSDSLLDLFDADVYAAAQPGVVCVSNSFGTVGGVPPEADLYDGFLVTPTGHLGPNGQYGGVAFFASSGDDGPGLSIPAASRNVVGVGGQSVVVDIDGTLEDIAAWAGSGGGLDTDYAPNYNEPLLALDADPESGVWIYDSTATGIVPVGWSVIGGTSLACPAMAAYMTIIDQGLEIAGDPSVGTDVDSDDKLGYELQDIVAFDNEVSLTQAESTFDTLGYSPAMSYPLWPKNPLNVPDTLLLTPSKGDTGWGSPVGPNFAASVVDYGGDWENLYTDLMSMMNGPQIVSSGTDAAGNLLDSLVFAQQPINVTAGQTFSNIVIDVDPFLTQTPDATFNGPVTLSVYSGPQSGTLVGTTTVDAVDGVATFSNVTADIGGNYYLEATTTADDTLGDGCVPGASQGIAVNPAVAVSLGFTQQPQNVWQYSTTQTVVVSVLDQYGNVATQNNGTPITISINSGPAGAVLTGKLTGLTVNGQYTFTGLSFSIPGVYTLNAVGGGFVPTTSMQFTVAAIPVRSTASLNGLPLSNASLLLEERRDGQVIVSTPAPAVVEQATTISAPVPETSPVLQSVESPTAVISSSSTSDVASSSSAAAASDSFDNGNLSTTNTDDGGADQNLLDGM